DLLPDLEVLRQIRPVADVDAIEVRAVGDVLAFKEMMVENVAAGEIEGGLRADAELYAGSETLIGVKEAIVAAHPIRQQIAFVLGSVSDVNAYRTAKPISRPRVKRGQK